MDKPVENYGRIVEKCEGCLKVEKKIFYPQHYHQKLFHINTHKNGLFNSLHSTYYDEYDFILIKEIIIEEVDYEDKNKDN